jgi:hypothetical protein
MYRRHAMDQDGAHGACKPLFDALVELGWARADSPACMEQTVASVIVTRERPRTEIVLQEAECSENPSPSTTSARERQPAPSNAR